MQHHTFLMWTWLTLTTCSEQQNSYKTAGLSLIEHCLHEQGAGQGGWGGIWAQLAKFMKFESGQKISHFIIQTWNMNCSNSKIVQNRCPHKVPHKYVDERN